MMPDITNAHELYFEKFQSVTELQRCSRVSTIYRVSVCLPVMCLECVREGEGGIISVYS